MAFRTVNPEDVEQEGGGKFLKMKDVFKKVGDKFKAQYISNETGTYGEEYTLRVEGGEDKVLSVSKQLHGVLKKCALKPGETVVIKYERDQDIGKENPMKVFKAMVDDSTAFKASPAAEADIPF